MSIQQLRVVVVPLVDLLAVTVFIRFRNATLVTVI
jgi:hypothetical protein